MLKHKPSLLIAISDPKLSDVTRDKYRVSLRAYFELYELYFNISILEVIELTTTIVFASLDILTTSPDAKRTSLALSCQAVPPSREKTLARFSETHKAIEPPASICTCLPKAHLDPPAAWRILEEVRIAC